jgi:hypothetical protein
MAFTPILLWYVIHSAVLIFSIIYKFIISGDKLLSVDMFILIAAGLYFIYMAIFSLVPLEGGEKVKGLISEKRTSFVQDHLFKYLCSIVFGCYFLFTVIELLSLDIGIGGNGPIQILIAIYIKFVFPICCFIDLFLTPRKRNPKPLMDLIIFAIVVLALSIIEWLGSSELKEIKKVLGKTLFRLVLGFDGYILYDFIMFKVNGGANGFTLFYTGTGGN